MAMGEIRGLR